MTVETYRYLRVFISALNSGIIASGTIVLTSLTGDHALTKTTIAIALATGILQMCTNFQAYISTPPHADAPAGGLGSSQGENLKPIA